MTVVLDRLEKAGAIWRDPNPNDRRSSLVHVVPGFLRSAETAYGKMAEATDALLAQFNDKELAVVFEYAGNPNGSLGAHGGQASQFHSRIPQSVLAHAFFGASAGPNGKKP